MSGLLFISHPTAFPPAPGPRSDSYLHPALSQFAYPKSALSRAWISILVSKVGAIEAV